MYNNTEKQMRIKKISVTHIHEPYSRTKKTTGRFTLGMSIGMAA